jgi:ribonuclease HI
MRYESKLRQGAEELTVLLKAEQIIAEIDEVSFREYHVKLVVPNAGNIILYYSPKKNTYKLNLREMIDEELKKKIQNIWEPPQGQSELLSEDTITDAYVAYVDGSYRDGIVGYGAVIIHNDAEQKRLFGSVEDDSSRQVAGELMATMEVIDWCTTNDVSHVHIYYDYKGIKEWAIGTWKAKSPVAQDYVNFLEDHSVAVTWHKVKSHSGVKWNDVADELARQGTKSAAQITPAETILTLSKGDYAMQKVEHYYKALFPYRSANFSFKTLATSLEEAIKIIHGEDTNLEHHKYDFASLDQIYRELKESIK